MSKLFAPGEINGLKLKNRFVRSATLEGMAAVDGTCTARLTEFMAALARGGVGLISSSHCYVQNVGKVRNGQLRINAGDLTKSACVSDNKCFRPAIEGKGVYCVTEKGEKAK